MSMVIGTNVASLTAQRHLASSRVDMETSMERLASGSKINSAMDDAAGLGIAKRMDAQLQGLNQAINNANDGVSMLQTAEGGLEQTTDILLRMRELAIQAKSGTYTDTDRDNMDLEYQQLSAEITRIAEQTTFNAIAVLDSTAATVMQVGSASGDSISVTFQEMTADKMGGGAFVSSTDLQSVANATTAIGLLDTAIADVSKYRGDLGAVSNRLTHTVENLMNRVENTSASQSRIQDTDFAVESANLAKSQVLQQAGTAMLAQANQSGQAVLSLLK